MDRNVQMRKYVCTHSLAPVKLSIYLSAFDRLVCTYICVCVCKLLSFIYSLLLDFVPKMPEFQSQSIFVRDSPCRLTEMGTIFNLKTVHMVCFVSFILHLNCLFWFPLIFFLDFFVLVNSIQK